MSDGVTAQQAPAAPGPVRDLLGRQARVLAAAWSARHELAGPRRLAHEAAFLPAALSLRETPVHPAPRRAMWLIISLFVAALAWSILGRVDIVAVAPGRIVLSDRSKLIQPAQSAVVKAIHVKDGDRVQAGQLLVELDATEAAADVEAAQQQQASALQESQRSERLLQALSSRSLRTEGLHAQAAILLQAEWSEWLSRRARLDGEMGRKQAELVTARGAVDKLQALLPIARQREADFESLRSEGAVAAHAAQDRARERIEVERDLATQQARLMEAELALEESRRAQEADEAGTRRAWTERLGKARLELGQWSQQGSKTRQREALARLSSPVSGTVQQLAVHTSGGVVTPAQVLMVVVPDLGQVVAEVSLPNADIGFVQAGQDAEVKIETFNFTRYGTVPARVLHVSADAVVDDKGHAAFTATLAFDRDRLTIDGRPVRLSAGMNVTAEIKTGRRRVMEYLWSPVAKTVGVAWRER
jgi:hemolysin D